MVDDSLRDYLLLPSLSQSPSRGTGPASEGQGEAGSSPTPHGASEPRVDGVAIHPELLRCGLLLPSRDSLEMSYLPQYGMLMNDLVRRLLELEVHHDLQVLWGTPPSTSVDRRYCYVYHPLVLRVIRAACAFPEDIVPRIGIARGNIRTKRLLEIYAIHAPELIRDWALATMIRQYLKENKIEDNLLILPTEQILRKHGAPSFSVDSLWLLSIFIISRSLHVLRDVQPDATTFNAWHSAIIARRATLGIRRLVNQLLRLDPDATHPFQMSEDLDLE